MEESTNRYSTKWIHFGLIDRFQVCKLIAVVVVLLLATSCRKDRTGTLSPWYPEINENGDSILGVFESRIPCDICERLKFSIVIYGDSRLNLPSTYIMSRIYVGRGNDRTTNTGDIIITTGTALDALHTVYQLTSGAPEEYRFFWKINDHLLFMLDSNRVPMVGDAGEGYVLNRTR